MKVPLSVSEVAAVGPGVLLVTWDDGVKRRVELSAQLRGPAVLDMLNVPEVFRDVSVVLGGGGVEWLNGADYSARSLRIWSDEQLELSMRKSA